MTGRITPLSLHPKIKMVKLFRKAVKAKMGQKLGLLPK